MADNLHYWPSMWEHTPLIVGGTEDPPEPYPTGTGQVRIRFEPEVIGAKMLHLSDVHITRYSEFFGTQIHAQTTVDEELRLVRLEMRALSEQVTALRAALTEQQANRKAEFDRLVSQWQRERPKGVDLRQMSMHPTYQRIIGMGPEAIPLILGELEKMPEHWFSALNAITGIDPVPTESQGRLPEMAAAWVQWGRRMGYRW